MRFETINENDLEVIKKLQPTGWSDISKQFKLYIDNSFCFPIKNLLNHNLIGIGNSIVFGKTAWLSHIIVDSSHRNKGVGLQIVKKLLKDLQTKSVESISLIATELGTPVYKKTGFKTITNYIILEREKTWIEYPASNKILPFNKDLYSGLIKLDYLISGEDRESLIQMYLADALVFLDREEIKGYYLPSLGEGPILAINQEAGTELMKVKYSKINKAVLPEINIQAIQFLRQNGFIEREKKIKRMALGKDLNWQAEKIFGRIGGNYG